jgi:long-chain fatty acid transport protein
MQTLARAATIGGAAAGAMLAAAAPAAAAGFYIQEQSPRAAGRAYSGEAADSGVESLWWNPAAIAGAGRAEVAASVEAIIPSTRAVDAGSTIQRPGQAVAAIGGADGLGGTLKPGAAPAFGLAIPLGERFTMGLSATAPFNITNAYPDDAWTRYDTTKARITDVDLGLVGAVRLSDAVSAGVGFDAQYASATLRRVLPNLSPLLADGRQNLSGDGWDYGWNAGLQIRAGEALTLGASYRSAIRHRLSGTATLSGLLGPLAGSNAILPARATFSTPWIATLGVRWRVTDRLTFDAEVQRFGWSRFDAITVTSAAGAQASPQGYRDTTAVAIGLDFAASERTTLRGGVQRDQTPTPDDGRSASVPDGDRWLIAAGLSQRLGAHARLEVNADYIAIADGLVGRSDTVFAGTAAATAVRTKGVVAAHALVFGAGVDWTF